jgi:uncharacterized protein (UPF0276 family)
VDIGWMGRPLPPWLADVLEAYGAAGRLHGHGTGFSLLSGRLDARQLTWLSRLRREVASRPYRTFSEHFGWMTAGAARWGPPLPPPASRHTIALGRDRMLRLAEAAAPVGVGLENLALALGRRDVQAQPDLLAALLGPVNGHLHLDLHNLWCQAVNFGEDPHALLARYPLDRARVVHVSGGSETTAAGRPFRRDTHDGAVPAPVWALLDDALGRCPHLEAAFLERIGSDFGEGRGDAAWARDFATLEARVRACGRPPTEWSPSHTPPPGGPPVLAPRIESWQLRLHQLLAAAAPPDDIRRVLRDPDLDDAGLETAAALWQRWGRT